MAQLLNAPIPKSTLAEFFGCLNCLSKSELWNLLVWILGTYEAFDLSNDGNLDALLSDNACYDCMDDRQKLQATIVILGNELLEGSEDTWRAEYMADSRFRNLDSEKVFKLFLYFLYIFFNQRQQV